VLRHDALAELREGIEDSVRTLGVEQLAAVNLRLMTNDAPDDRSQTSSARWCRPAKAADQASLPCCTNA
jgi:hypothetical protein